MITGYFANHGRRVSKVHIVQSSGKTICGLKLKGQFHWCANGAQFDYLSCEKCRNWYINNMQQWIKSKT